MAGISFNKLGLKVDDSTRSITLKDGTIIKVASYLPLGDKLDLASRVINNSKDDNTFYNCGLLEMNIVLEIVYNYTDISFTEKQKENSFKTYDIIMSSGLWNDILNVLPETEYQWIRATVYHTVDKIYEYNHSVYGIMDNLQRNYSDLNIDFSNVTDQLKDPNVMPLLKDVLTKMG